MTFILAASGKKQSGKDTLLTGLRPTLESRGIVKTYSFADEIKKFLISGMGLRHEQVWGTDADKNSLTEYKWEDMPKYIRWDFNGRWYGLVDGCPHVQYSPMEKATDIESAFWRLNYKGHQPNSLRSGYMTARELMQVFGTDLMRRTFSDRIWVNAALRAIEQDNPDIALIPDMRFPSEFGPLYEKGAYIVRLMRDVSKGDQHPSETALDNWPWAEYDRVLVVPADKDIDGCRQMAMDWLETRLPPPKPQSPLCRPPHMTESAFWSSDQQRWIDYDDPDWEPDFRTQMREDGSIWNDS